MFGTVRLLLMLALGGAAANGADDLLRIPPIPVRLDVEGLPLAVTISGTVASAPVGQSEETLQVGLDADLTDLQHHLTELLRSKLNQNERCGERLSVESATLAPAAPSGALTANIHVEKWGCAKASARRSSRNWWAAIASSACA